jgi:hypothetical protein
MEAEAMITEDEFRGAVARHFAWCRKVTYLFLLATVLPSILVCAAARVLTPGHPNSDRSMDGILLIPLGFAMLSGTVAAL